jgi:hypothetical protein
LDEDYGEQGEVAMSEERLYTVQAVEGTEAKLVDEAGHQVSVNMFQLPRGATEGIVIRVRVSADGAHDWVLATADAAETTRRRSSQHELRDPSLEEMDVDDVT